MDAGGFDDFRQKQEYTRIYPGSPPPPEGEDLHPTCLILYCLCNWSCYNGAQMRSGESGRRWRVLAYACGIYARSDVYTRFEISPSWPPLLALIWGARSRDLVQVGYRYLRTLTSLGLRVSSCSWAATGMPKVRTRGVIPSSPPVAQHHPFDEHKDRRVVVGGGGVRFVAAERKTTNTFIMLVMRTLSLERNARVIERSPATAQITLSACCLRSGVFG
jgi:hypothetical protein